MPRPKKGESRSSFVSRYMGSSHAKKKFPSQKQRAAVAYSEWRSKGKKKKR